ncbi:MAG: glutamate racemase [Anaerolineae bacterium]
MSNASQRLPPGTVGVFDSGVGGLSVVRVLLALMPSQSFSYVADNAHCPYGPRPASEIISFAKGITRYLQSQGCQVIVVACNTASAAALGALRDTFPDTSFVGMVPAIKPAAGLTRTGVVGVLATEGTLQGRLYEDVVGHWGHGARIVSRTCPGLVERVENGEVNAPETQSLLRSCLAPLLAEGMDVLVLGCTHYPFLIPVLKRLLPQGISIVEPSEAVAKQTRRVLVKRGLLAPDGPLGLRRYTATGDPDALQHGLDHLLHERPEVRRARWQHDPLLDLRLVDI